MGDVAPMGDVVGASPTDADLVAASLHDPQRFALLFDRHARGGPPLRGVPGQARRRGRRGFRNLPRRLPHADPLRPGFRRRPAVAARHRHQRFAPPPPVRGPAPDSTAAAAHPRDPEIDPAESVAAAVDNASEIDRVARSLARLDDRYRDVLLLAAGADLTYDEIARALGVPVGTVPVAPRPRPSPTAGTPRHRRAIRERRQPRQAGYRRDPRMIDELELLHRYIDATVDPDPDLETARRRLVTAIEEEGEAAPASWRPWRGSHRTAIGRRTAISLGSLAAAGVAAVVALLVRRPVRPARHAQDDHRAVPVASVSG